MFVFRTHFRTSARLIFPSAHEFLTAVARTHVAMYDGGPNVTKVLLCENLLYALTMACLDFTKCRSFANDDE